MHILLILLLGLGSVSAFAQDGRGKEVKDALLGNGDNAKNRGRKSLTTLLGFGPKTSYLAAGIHWHPNMIVEVGLNNYENNFGSSTNVMKLGTTHFVRDSLYWHFSLGARRVRYEFEYPATVSRASGGVFATQQEPEPNTAHYSDLGADLAFGNRWQWENFSVGVEWFGLYSPVHKVEHKLSDESQQASGTIRKEKERQVSDGIATQNRRFLTVHVGLSI